jgi:hypothetical protein
MRNLILSLWYRYKNWSYERKCIKYFGAKPETIYISKEAYNELVKRINAPADPEVQKRLRKLLEREAPWDKQ